MKITSVEPILLTVSLGPDEIVSWSGGALEKFHFWINNAGITFAIDNSNELNPDDFRKVIAGNLTGAFFGSQATAKRMYPKDLELFSKWGLRFLDQRE